MPFLDNRVFGFDISYYQDNPSTSQVVDFQKMKAYGASFVIIRAGQGNFIDPDWNTHKNNSRGVLPRAVYWFYDPIREPIAQASLLLSALDGEVFEGRIWLDLEFYWAGNYSAPRYWKAFRDRIKSTGLQFGIYTSKTWWDGKVTAAEAADFAQDPFWVAQYNTVLTRIPEGVVNAMMWQDGTPSIGIAAGVESQEIDHNKWNSLFDFNAEWGVQLPPPPPSPGGTMDYYEVRSTISTEYRSLRSDHSILSTKIDEMPSNGVSKARTDDVFTYATDSVISGILRAKAGDQWVHVFEINGISKSGWMAVKHLGVVYTVLKLISVPVPSDSLEFTITASSDGFQSQTIKISLPPV